MKKEERMKDRFFCRRNLVCFEACGECEVHGEYFMCHRAETRGSVARAQGAMKGQMQARPEREQVVKTAEKELSRAARSLAGAKKRGAPACDIENLEKKVAYKRLVLELICRV